MTTKNNKMKKILYVLGIAFLISCSSNVLDRNFNKENSNEDINELKNELTLSEFNSLTGFILKTEMEGKDLSGFTYKELLEKGIAFDYDYNKRSQ